MNNLISKGIFVLKVFQKSGLIFISTVLMALTATAQDSKYMVEDPSEAPPGVLFNEQAYLAGNSILNQYDNVLVVNKAAKGTTAQTLRVYSKGQYLFTTDVSTGREDVEIIKGVKKLFKQVFGGKGTTQSHWRHTTRGFYTIKRVEDADYRSGESKFQMPFAMFFNDHRGLAIHQVPPDLNGGEAAGESQLGQRASSGCVRVHKNIVQDIHRLVTQAGRGDVPILVTATGAPLLDSNGQVKTFKNYRSIVIVQEVQD